MTVESHASDNWERVAAELRACRLAQQQAWGDIDNTTLGRFLVGEVSEDERRHIENALQELPELRKLTDLVRDVLGDCDAISPSEEPVAVTATILPFPQPRRAAGFTPAGKRRVLGGRFRQRAGLVAAACLLLSLGLALPRSALLSPPDSSGEPGSGGTFVATHLPLSEEAKNLTLPAAHPADGELVLARVDASLDALEKQGKQQEAVMLARKYADTWTRQGIAYKDKGDLVNAECSLNFARALCTKKLDPTDPETVRNRNSVAEFYQVVLNAPAADAEGAFVRSALPQAAPPAAPLRVTAHKVQPGPDKPQTMLALRDRLISQRQCELRTSVVPVLTEALRGARSPQERAKFARALGQLGPAAREAVPVLVGCLRQTREPQERATVLLALGQIGPAARQALPVLLDALKSDNPQVCACASRAIIQFGPTARTYVHDLAKNDRRTDQLLLGLVQRIEGPEGRIGITDECECFTVKTIRDTQREIATLARAYHLEVRIETAPTNTLPAADAVAACVRDLGPNAVYLRICKQEPDVVVYLSDGLRKQGLTENAVRQVLAPHLRAGDFDAGLVKGVRFLSEFEKQRQSK